MAATLTMARQSAPARESFPKPSIPFCYGYLGSGLTQMLQSHYENGFNCTLAKCMYTHRIDD